MNDCWRLWGARGTVGVSEKREVTVEGHSTNRKETLKREKIAAPHVSLSCILGPKPYGVTSR